MRLINLCRIAALLACVVALAPQQSHAINLTNLDPVTALFEGDEDELSALAGGPGINGLNLQAATDTALGFTYNITFTPDAADLNGLVLLMEIGGTTNGVGVYLINGVPTLALKTGAAGTAPASESLSDLDFSDGAASVFSSYGPITAGNSYSVAATWGANNLYSLAVQDDTAQFSALDAVTITGQSDTNYNWEGNGTFNVADDLQPNPGSRGGLTDGSTTTIWNRDNMVNLTADLAPDSAIYWNDRATLSIDFGPPPPPPVPTVTVNRDTGNITITNLSGTPQTLIGYSLQTTNGGFDTSQWNKVDALDTNDTWEQLTAPGNPSTDISEATLGAGYVLDASGGANDSINFGNVWIQSPFEDIDLDFRNAAGERVTVNLVYEGNNDEPFALGDFDFMNGVDAADWAILRSNLISDPVQEGLLAYALGDINIDGLINEADFDAFKVAFDTANGLGAFASMIAGAPEPSALALLSLAGIVACGRRVRRAASVLSLALVFVAGAGVTSAQTNLFSDSFDRATTPQENDIDATTTGMSGTVGTLTYVENGDGFVPDETLTNLENNQLHVADGPNSTEFYLDHNFTEAAITTDGVLSISLDIVSNDGAATDNNRWVGFGLGATLAEFQGQTLKDFGATSASPALRGNINNADDGFGDLWVGWSPASGGVIQVVKNGNLVQTIPDGGVGPAGTLELRMHVADFDAGTPVPATIYYGGVPVGGDAFRWDNTGANYIGLTSRQDGAGFTVDNLAITTSTDPLAVQTLSLEVYTDTGEVFLVGGAGDVRASRYTISSAGGLESGAFNGIGGDGGQPLGNGSGNGWELGGVQTDSLLNEFFLQADGVTDPAIGSGFRASLGAIYDTTLDARDLLIEYRLTNGTLISGAAVYTTAPLGLLGDFNGDNVVDAADYTLWRDNLGAADESAINNNGDGGGITQADYLVWRNNYGMSNTIATGSTAAAPEPAGAALLGLLMLLLGVRRPAMASARKY